MAAPNILSLEQKRARVEADPRLSNIYSHVFDALAALEPDERRLFAITEALFPGQRSGYTFVHAALLTLQKHGVVEYLRRDTCANPYYTFTDKARRDVALTLDKEMPDTGLFHDYLTQAERVKSRLKTLRDYDRPLR